MPGLALPCRVVPGVPRTAAGYGWCCQWRHGVRIRYRHRVAWIDAHGCLPPADTPHVLHHCDNPPCEEPAHLYAGSQARNVADAIERGRWAGNVNPGPAAHPGRPTPPAVVAEIRAAYAAGGVSYTALGQTYGLQPRSVGRIVRGERGRA